MAKSKKSSNKIVVRGATANLNRRPYAVVPNVSSLSDREKEKPSELDVSDFYTYSTSDKIIVIKNGVSKNNLIDIKNELKIDYDALSRILSVSRAKLLSKKSSEKFDQATSERIMLLTEVVGYGQAVFEDKQTFNEWLKTPSMALGNKSPIEFMDTIYGIQMVKAEIGRLEYGIY